MSRFVKKVFPQIDEKNLTAIILAASPARRMTTIGNRSLIKVNNTNLINYQIDSVKAKFKEIADIICVLGYEAERVYKTLPKGVRSVENERYADTNNVRSLSLALKACITTNILIIYGDLYFEKEVFDKFTHNKSHLVFDTAEQIEKSKVGGITDNGIITNLSFGLPQKWAQVALLATPEFDLLNKFVHEKANERLCIFEIFNLMIERGGQFCPTECNYFLKEISCVKDIEAIK